MKDDAIQYFDLGTELKRPELGREFHAKLQGLGLKLVRSLYMLVRTVKLYSPDNAIFNKPLDELRETINTILAVDEQVTLFRLEESVYMNNLLLRLDASTMENVKYLLNELEAHDIGGFSITKPVAVPELQTFIHVFSQDNAEKAQAEDVDKKLMSMKLISFKKLIQKLSEDPKDDDVKIDRKKYAMTIYSRGIYFMKAFIESVRGDAPSVPLNRASRIIQDLIEVILRGELHFLGLTTLKSRDEYILYHSMNVALLSIVFGKELGLSRTQLRDLGLAGLFADIGMALISQDVLAKAGPLSPAEQFEVARHSLLSVKKLLGLRGLSSQSIHRMVVAYEHHTDYGTVRRDPNGNPIKLLSRNNVSLFSRIVAICDGFDALTSARPFRPAFKPPKALEIMKKDIGSKYDPILFKVFSNVIQIGDHQRFKRKSKAAH